MVFCGQDNVDNENNDHKELWFDFTIVHGLLQIKPLSYLQNRDCVRLPFLQVLQFKSFRNCTIIGVKTK